jgi:hypothetical protein
VCPCFLQPLRCSTKLPPLGRLQANKLTIEACVILVTELTAKRCFLALIDRPNCVLVSLGVLAVLARSEAFVFVLLEMLGRSSCAIAKPNVRANLETAA